MTHQLLDLTLMYMALHSRFNPKSYVWQGMISQYMIQREGDFCHLRDFLRYIIWLTLMDAMKQGFEGTSMRKSSYTKQAS